jgi:hypothetical protein
MALRRDFSSQNGKGGGPESLKLDFERVGWGVLGSGFRLSSFLRVFEGSSEA